MKKGNRKRDKKAKIRKSGKCNGKERETGENKDKERA
jgi:hypothetical protein